MRFINHLILLNKSQVSISSISPDVYGVVEAEGMFAHAGQVPGHLLFLHEYRMR